MLFICIFICDFFVLSHSVFTFCCRLDKLLYRITSDALIELKRNIIVMVVNNHFTIGFNYIYFPNVDLVLCCLLLQSNLSSGEIEGKISY